jgi:hypothetical protein
LIVVDSSGWIEFCDRNPAQHPDPADAAKAYVALYAQSR